WSRRRRKIGDETWGIPRQHFHESSAIVEERMGRECGGDSRVARSTIVSEWGRSNGHDDHGQRHDRNDDRRRGERSGTTRFRTAPPRIGGGGGGACSGAPRAA